MPPGSLEAWAVETPLATALTDQRRSVDWATWNERANRLANALEQELGLAAGSRVAVRLHNRVEWFEVGSALAKLGAAPVPVGTRLTDDEVAYITSHSGAQLFVTDDPEMARAASSFGDQALKGTILVGGDPSNGALDFEELIRTGRPAPRVAGPPLGAKSISYTSGTTGRPKGAVRSYTPQQLQALAAIVATINSKLRLGPDEKHLVVAPLYHAAPSFCAQQASRAGGHLVLHERFDAEAALAEMGRGVTSTFMVPTMVRRILSLPEELLRTTDLSSLRALILGGAPFPAEMRAPAQEVLGEVLFDMYGSTETGFATMLEPADQVRKAASVGRALDGVDVLLLDEEHQPVTRGERGVLFIRSPMQVNGYYADEEATAESAHEGYFTAGDVAYQDNEGFLYIVDRTKDMILVGGANIYPAEIEQVLRIHPAVTDAAVFGIPNDDLGEEIKAIVELVPGETAEPAELIAHCGERLAKNKWPRSIDFLAELPRNPTGKILKRELRAPYWADRKRAI